MLDQISAIGRGYSSLHSLDETRFVLQIEAEDFLRERIGVASLSRGEFGKFRFLLRTEMYFHVFESR